MIGYIKGKVLEVFVGGVLLENNGIGYEVYCSGAAFERLVRETEGGVYTFMHVKEDGISLYGFDTINEKNMFLKLIGISGVGPKMGMTVLSSMSLADLATAIATSDVKKLSTVKGCGKKTAERIILELRESISSLDLDTVVNGSKQPLNAVDDDVVIALMSLGYTRGESAKLIENARANGAVTLDEILARAIRGF